MMPRLGLIISGVAMPVTAAAHIHLLLRLEIRAANQNLKPLTQ